MKKGKIHFLFILLFLLPSLISSQNDLKIEKKKEFYGIHNGKKWVVPPKYDQILQVSDACFITEKQGLYGYTYLNPYESYDFFGNEIFKTCRPFSQKINFSGTGNFSMRNKEGLYGLFDSRGNQLTNFDYSEVIHKNNYCLLLNKEHKWKIFKSDRLDTYFIADSILFLKNKVIAFKDKNGNGFLSMILIHESGDYHSYVYDPSFGRKKIWLGIPGPYYSIADEECNISDVLYDSVGVLPNGDYIAKQQYGGYEIFNQDFEPQLPKNLEVLRILKNGNYLVRSGFSKLGIFTPDMDTILTPKYSSLLFEGNYIRAVDAFDRDDSDFGGSKYLFDRNGNTLLSAFYQIDKLSSGKYLCKKSYGTWHDEKTGKNYPSKFALFDCEKGFIETGLEVEPRLSDGFYRITKNTSYYYLNKDWTQKSKEFPVGYIRRTETRKGSALAVIVKAVFFFPLMVDVLTGKNPSGAGTYTYDDKVYGGHFKNGYASFTQTNKGVIKFGVMDTSFTPVVPAIYPEIEVFDEIIFVRKSDKWAMMDKDHNFHSGFVYTEFKQHGDKFIIVKENSKYRFLTSKGEETDLPEFISYRYKKGDLIIDIDEFNHQYKVTEDGMLLNWYK